MYALTRWRHRPALNDCAEEGEETLGRGSRDWNRVEDGCCRSGRLLLIKYYVIPEPLGTKQLATWMESKTSRRSRQAAAPRDDPVGILHCA